MRIKNRWTTRSALLALPLAVLLLGACGGTAEEDDAASSGSSESSSGPTGGDSEAATDEDFMEWQLSHASCMRDNGIDMPDPEGDAGSLSIELESVDTDAWMAASEICREELGDPPMVDDGRTPEERLEQQLETAACLRENGFDIADPQPDTAMEIPADAPDEVLSECGIGMSTGAGS
ncbi:MULTISPECIES: hypothetical protein [Actinoalloteichus]|uniref:Secreted protein n=1 Tax=Actinoalloteichus fjordicus TaxID=1612552 RepID=A0AAC9PQ64_9PSEU|nr:MULTISPECIES: hypothetical protein [Actinoalloteichus]APU12622.1 hypothetical protein UA74_02675 [Actinoalloteichus fjordicus]APU18575.1 hypothetical protein UA75_02680 [Actinoalloteichus sp. GBA129-24]